jgi:putative peptidoglycan lipid II flippase
MQATGLALSTSCVALVNLVLLVMLMRRKIDRLDLRRVLKSTAKIAAASAVMTAVVWGANQWLGFNRYLTLVGSVALGMVVFFVACRAFKVDELNDLIRSRERA